MREADLLLAAVVLAGRSSHEDDPLAEYSLGRSKGLIPIAGRPMIAYVIRALTESRYLSRIVIVGLPEEARAVLTEPVEHVRSNGDMLANAEAGMRRALELLPGLDGVLIGSADLPLLTGAIVDRFIDACLESDHDLYYSIVERSLMEGRFPASRRTYVRLLEGEFAGGDLLLLRAGMGMVDQDLWRRLASARKNPIRQARMLGGVWPLVKLLSHRMSLAEAERRASKALGIRGRVLVTGDPEVGMDVDKPFQLEIARAEIEAQLGAGVS